MQQRIRCAVAPALMLGMVMSLTLPSSAQTAEERQTPSGTYYRFVDDLLPGDSAGPYGDVIRLPGSPARALLIRPRTSFVAELLNSVEQL